MLMWISCQHDSFSFIKYLRNAKYIIKISFSYILYLLNVTTRKSRIIFVTVFQWPALDLLDNAALKQ